LNNLVEYLLFKLAQAAKIATIRRKRDEIENYLTYSTFNKMSVLSQSLLQTVKEAAGRGNVLEDRASHAQAGPRKT
jgi:hypothetical protein